MKSYDKEDKSKTVYKFKRDDDSPDMNTWGTLYYQTLAYMGRVYPKYIGSTIRSMSLEETVHVCIECIENMKDLKDEIRELNDNDLENI